MKKKAKRITQKEATELTDKHFNELLEEIKQGKSEKLIKYLEFCSQLYKFSLSNRTLLFLQNPECSKVAKGRDWNKWGYKMKKGETALRIYYPSKVKYAKVNGKPVEYKYLTKKQKQELEILETTRFYLGPVFDISQVELYEDKGHVVEFFSPLGDDNHENYNMLKDLMIADDIKVYERDIVIEAGCQGVSFGGKVVIKNMDSTNMVLTIIHEWAHELLHQGSENKSLSKQYKEAQAEATAFIVCKHLGIDNVFSSDYIQNHGNNVDDLKKNLKAIVKASTHIITRIESYSIDSMEEAS